MIPASARAVAGQSRGRFLIRCSLSLIIVAGSALAGLEGMALAGLVIFSGITGPALRISTLRAGGVLDRIRVSPVSRPLAVLFFTAVWSAAVLVSLIPGAAVASVRLGPAILVPFALGTVLAVAVGTLAGLLAETLAGAHLSAILASGALMAGTVIPGLPFVVLPYGSLVTAVPSSAIPVQLAFLGSWLALLAAVSTRL